MGLSGIVKYGNYHRKSVELDGDTVITSGNYVLCRITTNGFNLNIQGGNVSGLYIDGVKHDNYVWQRREPLSQAVNLREQLLDKGGEKALDAFQIGIVGWIHSNPQTTYQDWKDGYLAEAVARGWFANVTTLQGFVASFFGLTDWAIFVDLVLSYTPDQWAGEATEIVEEHS